MTFEETLFKDFNPVPLEARKETCRTCRHRQRWYCGGSVIQYCGKLSSNRTFNKRLKIKCNKPACEFYVGQKGETHARKTDYI